MKRAVKDLEGEALNWAVAKAQDVLVVPPEDDECGWEHFWKPQPYSTEWANGGPIIEHDRILLKATGDTWVAYSYGQGHFAYGPTPLVAAMRCYVTYNLGEEIDIPEELT